MRRDCLCASRDKQLNYNNIRIFLPATLPSYIHTYNAPSFQSHRLHLQRRPAIHDPPHPSHIARPRTHHKQNHIRNLLGLRNPSHWYNGLHHRRQVGVPVNGGGHHGRIHPARAERIHAYAMSCVVQRCIPLYTISDIHNLLQRGNRDRWTDGPRE